MPKMSSNLTAPTNFPRKIKGFVTAEKIVFLDIDVFIPLVHNGSPVGA